MSNDSGSNQYDVFLSHNGKEKPAVERLAEKLRRAGLEPWLDKWCLTPGGDWQNELAAGLKASSACAVFIGPHGIGNWEDLEYKLATDRMAKDRRFRLFLVLLPGLAEPFDAAALPPFLSLRTWVDLRRGIDDTRAFQSLINAIKGLPLGPERAIEPRNDVCPYRGLQTFDEEHAQFFFGRDGDTQRLIEKLKGTRFLAVLGPSGSGKSSLVRAGLIPALRRGQLPGSDIWPIQLFTPTAHPLTQLSANLLRLYPQGAMGQTLDQMLSDERTLHLAIALAMAERPANERAVLVVDQFEEVFTLCRDERERAQFLANLLYAAFIPDGRCVVLLTLRADFYPKCAAYPELSARLAEHQFLVSPMDSDGLRQAIEEPAWRVGLEFESGLSETILKDVQSQPGALPLLEHALLELWERRRGGMLTLEAYRESGGVEGAIAKRADSIYELFTPEQQTIVRRVMIRLTQFGEGTEDTRRRAMMSELITCPEESEAVESVVKKMADASLLTTSADEETGERVVEVSHEALIQGWPKLREWLDEDRSGLLIHHRLRETVKEWRRLGKNYGVLYRGPVLALAIEWQSRNEGMCNQVEREFLQESLARQTEERRIAESRWHRGDIIYGVLIVALVIAVGVAMFFYYRATNRAKEADQYRESADEALKEKALLERSVEDSAPKFQVILHGHGDEVNTVSFSPDGKSIVTAGDDGAVIIWDMAGHVVNTFLFRQAPSKLISAEENCTTAMFTANGRFIVAANGKELTILDAASGEDVGTISSVPTVHGKGSVFPYRSYKPVAPILACSNDGKCLVTYEAQPSNGRVWMSTWNITVSAHPTIRDFSNAKLKEELRKLEENSVYITDLDGAPHVATFSPDGSRVAILSGAGKICVWEMNRSKDKKAVKISEFDSGPANSIACSPDGNRIVIASSDNAAYIWQVRDGQQLAKLRGHKRSVNSAAYSPDGKFIVTASDDGTARVWDTTSNRPLSVLHGHIGPVYSAVFSPDGKYIATASGDQTARIWKHLASK